MSYLFQVIKIAGDSSPVNIYAGTPSKLIAKEVVLPYNLTIDDSWSNIYVESTLECGVGKWINLPEKPTTTHAPVNVVWTTAALVVPSTLPPTTVNITTTSTSTTVAPIYLSILVDECFPAGRRVYMIFGGDGYDSLHTYFKIVNSSVIGSETIVVDWSSISQLSTDEYGRKSIILPNGFYDFYVKNTITNAQYEALHFKIECIASTSTTSTTSTISPINLVTVYNTRPSMQGYLATFQVRLQPQKTPFLNTTNITVVGRLYVLRSGTTISLPFSVVVPVNRNSADVTIQLESTDTVVDVCIENIYPQVPSDLIQYIKNSTC